MAKREYTLRKNCAHKGCAEVSNYKYSTRRDLLESYESKHEFRCIRHTKPDEVLTLNNLEREVIMTSKKSEGCGDRLYWDNHGFRHGPGFKAWADEFPEGTQLIVTARIVLPK